MMRQKVGDDVVRVECGEAAGVDFQFGRLSWVVGTENYPYILLHALNIGQGT